MVPVGGACSIWVLPRANLRFYAGRPSRFHYFGLKGAPAAELKTAVRVTESERAVKRRPEASKRQLLGHIGPWFMKVGTSECDSTRTWGLRTRVISRAEATYL
jgi:hypothetical protein